MNLTHPQRFVLLLLTFTTLCVTFLLYPIQFAAVFVGGILITVIIGAAWEITE